MQNDLVVEPPSKCSTLLFVNRDSIEHCECQICLNVQLDPVQCQKGHGFCRSCIENWIRDCEAKNESAKCPTCQAELNKDNLVPNRTVEGMISGSIVYCFTQLPRLLLLGESAAADDDDENMEPASSSSSSGVAAAGSGKRKKCANSKASKSAKPKIDRCQWQGALRNAAEHFRTCEFAGVKCSCEGCDEVMVRADLTAHNRVCDHRMFCCIWYGCDAQLKAKDRDQHQLECVKRMVPCPNAAAGCSHNVGFDSVTQHRASCLYERCACPFADVGCPAHMLRKEIEQHEDAQMKRHNRLLLKGFKEQRQAIDSMKDHVMQNTEKIVFHVKYDLLTGKEPFVPRFSHHPSRLYSEDLVIRGYTITLHLESKDSRPENQDHYGIYLTFLGGPLPCTLNYTLEVVHHDGLPASTKKNINKGSIFTGINAGWGAAKLISKAEVASLYSPYVKYGYVTFKATFTFA